MAAPSIVRECQNFAYAVGGEEDWSNTPSIQKQAHEMCEKCIKWLTPQRNDEDPKEFGELVTAFFCMLREFYKRKCIPEEEVRVFRDTTLAKIQSFSQHIQNPKLLDFLKYNTYLGDSSQDSSEDSSDEDFF